MSSFAAVIIRARVRRLSAALALLALVALAGLAALPAAASAAFTQLDVNAAIENGVTFLDANQNVDGSWGASYHGAETALALASYGVLDSGKFSNLSAARQTRVENGINFLLGTQGSDGSFSADGLKTYDTGLALTALSLNTDVPTTPAGGVATAVANARAYLISHQNITANGVSCQSTGANGTGLGGQGFCGGWDYNGPDSRSDESNTGFALTGLDLTGGVPPATATADIGWQRNVQQLTSNPGGFTARNDGGGAYEPGISSGTFSSNANDTGSLLFGYGYDNVPGSDPAVQAAIKFGTDVLDTYELNKATRTMVFHTGMNEDGSCDTTTAGCDWSFGSGEGGYHYSMFALVKGLSQYITPDLTDPSNFYAKAVDLLLSQQAADGSWPADLRDDASVIGATGFAILALGRVGIPVFPITATGTTISTTEDQSFTGTVATFTVPSTTPTANGYSVTIDWGDGHTSAGTVTGGSGTFTVAGTHTYTEEGSFTAKVTITDLGTPTNTGSATTSATVHDAALLATGGHPALSGRAVSGTVATFTDDNPAGAVSDFTASINWGDGTTTTGTITESGGTFSVNGSHTYAGAGTFPIKVSIKDDGGSTAGASATVTIPAAHHHHHQRSVVHGAARLIGAPMACVLMPFATQIKGKRIASVAWSLDRHRLGGKTVHRGTRYSARVTLSPGRHHLTVKVKFVAASRTGAKTFRRTVSGCPIVVPEFTG